MDTNLASLCSWSYIASASTSHLTKNNIIDWFKIQAYREKKIKCHLNFMISAFDKICIILGKGENADPLNFYKSTFVI